MTNSHSQRTIENKEKLLKSQGETENTSDCMATPRKTNSTIVKTPSYIESTPIFSFEESETSTPINPTSLKPKKSNVPHDSDEEFLPSNRKRPKLKLTKSERPLANKTRLEQTTKTSSGNMVDSLENCKIRNVKIKPENESSDEEVFARVKKRKIKVITDDEDSCRGSQNSLNTLSDDFINGSVKTTEIPEACLGSKKNICKKSSFVDNLEDEEDAFTSTPDKEKNEKRYLIEKIYILENQIREKRKKLENLKQASVYKAIHNIEDLGKLTEKYREACVEGLRGLLSQLQAHTSISMPTLLHNLHIPGEMVTKLALSEEI
ncbi:hypothetical protein JTB14_023605 [Gonioctena quinquepunctata]|nr:hypothetical protein JTB14_023605 [Gonioctena quinquepunctata]